MPTLKQLKFLPRMLTAREQRSLVIAGIVCVLSITLLTSRIWTRTTVAVPKVGGTYIEGLVGTPRFINPLLAAGSDVDRDIATLVFAGLTRVDAEGNVVPDMADTIRISEDQTVYTITLRKDLAWHDGEPVTVDDVIYTFQTIQDPAFKSSLRLTFTGVTVSRIDRETVSFTLAKPSPSFLSALSVGIIPAHIWYSIPAAQAHLAEANVKPIGSGRYRFEALTKDTNGIIRSIELARNGDFHGSRPYIEELIFKFYADFPTAVEALRNKNVDGLSFLPVEFKPSLDHEQLSAVKELNLPQYNALYFNPSHNDALKDKAIRQALGTAIDRERIIRDALAGNGRIIDGPIIPGFSNTGDTKGLTYDPSAAHELLQGAGWAFAEDATVRSKDEVELTVRLTTVDQEATLNAARIIEENWTAVGIRTELVIVDADRIRKDVIEPRDYEVLLFGQIIVSGPETYAFWHSSQNVHPGNNLTLLANKDIDAALEALRDTTDTIKQNELYQQFYDKLHEEIFAIFLYNPNYLYPIGTEVRGTDTLTGIAVPSDRFASIAEWYIRTSRQFQ